MEADSGFVEDRGDGPKDAEYWRERFLIEAARVKSLQATASVVNDVKLRHSELRFDHVATDWWIFTEFGDPAARKRLNNMFGKWRDSVVCIHCGAPMYRSSFGGGALHENSCPRYTDEW